ncbi:MAG: Asp-tRNA(Asn)/Glu-tRNA(Gln) amidotransferase subunit GatB [Bacteroidia bacterium]
MSSIYDKYETVVGLEVHAQLLTATKAYSNDLNEYGGLPNTNVSAITLGLPGTLPMHNAKVMEYAVRLGLAVNATIREENQYARKNYFYADLPKGYQITQDTTPVCNGGYITIKLPNGTEKNINLTRIHWEEDAGKSIHDQDPFDTLIDLNRAGTPLLEIVTEPDFSSSEEAYVYLNEVRKLLRYIGICDGNMEEGSMRCDANISVRLKGAEKLGRRTEVKNMNSMRNVQRAIDFEVKRQIDVLEAGGTISQDTRGFDPVTGETTMQRSKETANDYRYFPEPDLPPVFITQDYIASIKATMPLLPNQLFDKYVHELKLPEYDANVIIERKEFAMYFEQLILLTTNYKAASNWVMGPVKSYLNEYAIDIDKLTLTPQHIADMIAMTDANKINFNIANQQIMPALIATPSKTALQVATELNVIQESNADLLSELVTKVLAQYPEKVAEYKAGKMGLLGLFMGEVMKLSGGKADPKLTTQLLKQQLDN